MSKHLCDKRGITFQEYGALLGVRTLLANGDLQGSNLVVATVPGEHLFNMETVGNDDDCGTVGCIGGNMALLMGQDPFLLLQREPLKTLFFPSTDYAEDWSWITPPIAVQAIDNWLKTGKPKWSSLKPK